MAIDSFTGMHFYLSNFYEHPIQYAGIEWPSNEHAYQAMKTLDPEQRKLVLTAPDPGKAKKFGRMLELRPDWEQVKIPIMLQIVRRKFEDRNLARYLVETGGIPLIEGNNWHDNFWGICDNTCKYGNHEVFGHNNLGKILEKVRKELRIEWSYPNGLG